MVLNAQYSALLSTGWNRNSDFSVERGNVNLRAQRQIDSAYRFESQKIIAMPFETRIGDRLHDHQKVTGDPSGFGAAMTLARYTQPCPVRYPPGF